MVNQELNQEYIEELRDRLEKLKHRYAVLWTYYQTGQSLLRTLLKTRRIEDMGLETLFTEIKQVENELDDATEVRALIPKIQGIEQRLQRIHYLLTEFDNNISPGVTRRYIERLQDYDPRFLIYLVEFYLSKYPMSQEDWDKIDLLLTKLTIHPVGGDDFALIPDAELRKLQKVLTKHHEIPYSPPERVRACISDCQAIAAEVRKVKSYNDLLEWGLLARIRDFKKNVQHLMLHPDVMPHFLRLNLTSKKKFSTLYRYEVERIHSALKTIDDREVSFSLPKIKIDTIPGPSYDAGEDFVHTLETLQAQVNRLTQLVQEFLKGKDEGGGESEQNVPMLPLEQELELVESATIAVPRVLQPVYEQIVKAFDSVDWSHNLSEIAYSEPLNRWGIEPFEVESYQMGFLLKNQPKTHVLAHRLVVLSMFCHIRMSALAREILAFRKKNPEYWVAQLSDTMLKEIRALFTISETYERILRRWSLHPELPHELQKRLNRTLRKLQRAKVGLYLLYDLIEEDWLVRKGEVPDPSSGMMRAIPIPTPATGQEQSMQGWTFYAPWAIAFLSLVALIVLLLLRS